MLKALAVIMKFLPTTNEKLSLVPSFVGAGVFFIVLGLSIPPGANWVMAAIVSAFSLPIIYVINLAGSYGAVKLQSDSSILNYTVIGLLGAAVGLLGFFIANAIAYFSGTVHAFILSGLFSGLCLQLQITVNKSKHSDAVNGTGV